jgi:hypothetical protein
MQAAAAAAPSWMVMKNLPVLRTRLAAASSFHSTPLSSEKWKNKWDCPKVRRPPPFPPSSTIPILFGKDNRTIEHDSLFK